MSGINKLHKYAGPENWLLVDKNGDFQEVREGVFDALNAGYASGTWCELDIIHVQARRPHVVFHNLLTGGSWCTVYFGRGDSGWMEMVIDNLPEECRLSDAAKAELVDKLGWFQQVSFFFL